MHWRILLHCFWWELRDYFLSLFSYIYKASHPLLVASNIFCLIFNNLTAMYQGAVYSVLFAWISESLGSMGWYFSSNFEKFLPLFSQIFPFSPHPSLPLSPLFGTLVTCMLNCLLLPSSSLKSCSFFSPQSPPHLLFASVWMLSSASFHVFRFTDCSLFSDVFHLRLLYFPVLEIPSGSFL